MAFGLDLHKILRAMKILKPITLAFVIVTMLIPVYCFAKEPSSGSALKTFSGSIIDKSTNEDLGGVYLYFEELQKGIYSDQDGKFNLEGIEPGEYNVTVKFISYHDKKLTVKVGTSEDNYTKILLEPIQP